MVPPRVLIVEDDAAIRQFVCMALEDHAIELVECPTLAAARRSLASAPAAAVLLDMMLPDGTGLDLLRDAELRRTHAATRWIIFSAGLSPAITAELASLQIDQLLRKPVSLSALCSCIEQAVAPAGASGSLLPPATPGSDIGGGPGQPDAPDGSTAAQAHALEVYFEGDQALFVQMKQQARRQFLKDAATGDAAVAAGDLTALRRVAHSLKTVLRMLAYPQAGERARELESLLAAGRPDGWHPLWTDLRHRIMDISTEATPWRPGPPG